MPCCEGGCRAWRSSASALFNAGVGIRPGASRRAAVYSSSRSSPRPVFAETGDQRRPLPQADSIRRPDILDRHLARVPLRRARRASSSPPSAPRPRPRGPGRRRLRSRRSGRARRSPARPLRARAAPSSTRSLPLLPLPPQAGRVDEAVDALVAPEDRVDRVARRSGHVGDDDPLPPDECVQERRLADVGAAEDGDADRLVADLRPRLARQPR